MIQAFALEKPHLYLHICNTLIYFNDILVTKINKTIFLMTNSILSHNNRVKDIEEG